MDIASVVLQLFVLPNEPYIPNSPRNIRKKQSEHESTRGVVRFEAKIRVQLNEEKKLWRQACSKLIKR